MARITLLGNFSGRNAGDNAILGNLVRDLSGVLPQAQFIVPTLNPAAVLRICLGFNVQPLGLRPWHGAIKIFGLGTLRAMLQTDCVLVTDNILFDKRFYNPLFNYLATIALFAPLTQHRGIPIILYNASVGPIDTAQGAAALRRILRASPFAILRDRASVDLIERLAEPVPELIVAADCALNTEPASAPAVDALERQLGILRDGRPRIALNVNSYIDEWRRPPRHALGRARFIAWMAAAFSQIIKECGAQPVFFVTQVMDQDMTRSVRAAMKLGYDAPLAMVGACDYRELTRLLQRMDLLIAMRTHALILAASVHTPVVNLNAYPKSAAFMNTLGQRTWNLDIEDLTEFSLIDMAREAWQARAATRAELEKRVPLEKAKALASAHRIRDLLVKPQPAAAQLSRAQG